jgi:hypothetical protein
MRRCRGCDVRWRAAGCEFFGRSGRAAIGFPQASQSRRPADVHVAVLLPSTAARCAEQAAPIATVESEVCATTAQTRHETRDESTTLDDVAVSGKLSKLAE